MPNNSDLGTSIHNVSQGTQFIRHGSMHFSPINGATSLVSCFCLHSSTLVWVTSKFVLCSKPLEGDMFEGKVTGCPLPVTPSSFPVSAPSVNSPLPGTQLDHTWNSKHFSLPCLTQLLHLPFSCLFQDIAVHYQTMSSPLHYASDSKHFFQVFDMIWKLSWTPVWFPYWLPCLYTEALALLPSQKAA